MGWASAGYIFDPVCEALQKSFMVPEARQKILVTLIKALQEQDWDTVSASLERFADDPVVVKAFKEAYPEMFEEDDDFQEFRGRW